MRRLWTLLLLTACTDVLAPPLDHVQLIQPPAPYARWYANAERCSGVIGRFDRLRWYRVDEPLLGNGKAAMTYLYPHSRRIVIAAPYLMDSLVVAHESLHDILDTHEHPAAFRVCAAQGVMTAH